MPKANEWDDDRLARGVHDVVLCVGGIKRTAGFPLARSNRKLVAQSASDMEYLLEYVEHQLKRRKRNGKGNDTNAPDVHRKAGRHAE